HPEQKQALQEKMSALEAFLVPTGEVAESLKQHSKALQGQIARFQSEDAPKGKQLDELVAATKRIIEDARTFGTQLKKYPGAEEEFRQLVSLMEREVSIVLVLQLTP